MGKKKKKPKSKLEVAESIAVILGSISSIAVAIYTMLKG